MTGHTHYPKLDEDTYHDLSFPGRTLPPEADMAICGADLSDCDQDMLPLSYSYPNCPDCEKLRPKMPRGPYQRAIYKLDPTVNAAGVECSMRLRHGTLNHLPRETFVEEIGFAKACEQLTPGHLKACAEELDMLDAWNECEALGQPGEAS